MCVICISNKNIRQPNKEEITTMFVNNPDGAGFMYLNSGKVQIEKGFMTVDAMINRLNELKFTKDDVVIYHFRIGTQGAKTKGFTHPYPLTDSIEECKKTKITTNLGICHNGVIHLTSDGNPNYNDTMLYITTYLTSYIWGITDVQERLVQEAIESDTNSRWAFLDSNGNVTRIGRWIHDMESGLFFSNNSYIPRRIYSDACKIFSLGKK